jgi:threonine synthase
MSGLQVASVLDGQEVLEAVLFTGGSGQMVSDEDIYHWQRRLIREEGIYAEPAAAASLAGLASAAKKGLISEGESVVCLITGSGFKDNGAIRRLIGVDQLPLINVAEI